MSGYNTRRLATRNSLTVGTERMPENIHRLGGSAFATVNPWNMPAAVASTYNSRSRSPGPQETGRTGQDRLEGGEFTPIISQIRQTNVEVVGDGSRPAQRLETQTLRSTSSFFSGTNSFPIQTVSFPTS